MTELHDARTINSKRARTAELRLCYIARDRGHAEQQSFILLQNTNR